MNWRRVWILAFLLLLFCVAFDVFMLADGGGPEQPNPNCPHYAEILAGVPQDSTNCMPPPECICQQACAVLCKP